MYNPPIKLDAQQRKATRPIIDALYPDYKGRKVAIQFTDRVTFSDTNWDGGSKSYYKFIGFDGRVTTLEVPAPWNNQIEGKTVDLPADVLVVEHSYFCGTDCGITIYANPANAPKLLPEGGR